MQLLLELAGDISFALDHIDKSERITYLAYYDPLTGLANATLFPRAPGAITWKPRARVVTSSRWESSNVDRFKEHQRFAGPFPQGTGLLKADRGADVEKAKDSGGNRRASRPIAYRGAAGSRPAIRSSVHTVCTELSDSSRSSSGSHTLSRRWTI